MSTFNQIYSDHINKICLVFNKNAYGSGLLFWYDNKLYLLTVKHILNNINNPIMYSISNVNIWNKDLYKYEQITQVLAFICIGFDTTSDIAVCAYNSTLNINNNIEYLSTDRTFNKNYLEAFEFTDFIDSRQLSIGDKIIIIGQSNKDNNTMSSGIIKDNAYNGFPQNIEMVESILCDVASYKGASGSPIINTNNKICGIVIGGFDKYFDHLTIGVSSRILRLVIPKLIKKYMDFSFKNSISDISRILLSTTLKKSYFGIFYKHLNYNFFINNNELQNKLKNIGGILVYDFIVGLDTLNNNIIYNFTKINNSTISIHNPFQYNVVTIQLNTNMTINQIISTYKTPFIDLQVMNNLLGLNENSTINTGSYINVFNNLNINTKLWQIYYDKIFKSHPLIFTKIWFTKDNYVNNVNVGEWIDLNIGKYKGQVPLSDFVFDCSREIIIDPIKNIPIYRFNTSNMSNVVDKSTTKITNMVDVNGEVLTIGDIIIEFYYNISKSVDLSNNLGSWVGPVYQKIKPYVIYNKISNGQNNTDSYVLSIEQPSILNNLESALQIDTYYDLDIIEKRNEINDKMYSIIKKFLFGNQVIVTRNGTNISADSDKVDILDFFQRFLSDYEDSGRNQRNQLLNDLNVPEYYDTINEFDAKIPLYNDDNKPIKLDWNGFLLNYLYINNTIQ
jgi:hypothetical protein